MDADQVAAAGLGPGLQGAAVEVDPLPHADQSVTAPTAVSGARPVVCDLEIETARPVADGDGCVCGAGVLEGVGQGFLDDPVCRQVEPRGKEHRFAFDPE